MQEVEKQRVAVIFGGRSVEHEVSILTAHQVMAVLEPRHEVVPVYVDRDGRWFTSPKLRDLEVYEARAWSSVGRRCWIELASRTPTLRVSSRSFRGNGLVEFDIAVPAIHGTYGEDGTLQGLLELAGVPYTGSGVTASALGMDKVAMRAAFESAGLAVPKAASFSSQALEHLPRVVAQAEAVLTYPVFVKPAACGSSVGVSKAQDADTFALALRNACRFDLRVLVEEAAAGCIEVNCSVVGNRDVTHVSVCEQPLAGGSEFLTYAVKYAGGYKAMKAAGTESMTAARRIPPIDDALTEEVRHCADRAFRAVGAEGVARVDCFVDEAEDRVVIGEINTIPGSFSCRLWQESGVNFADLMDRLLELGLERHAARSERVFTAPKVALDRSPGR